MGKNIQKSKDRRKGITLFLLLFFALALASIFVGIICLDGIKIAFFERNFRLLAVVYGAIVCFLFGVSAWATLSKKQAWRKALLGLFLFLLTALVICAILQRMGFFEIVGTPERLREYLEKTGAWMASIYTLLQFLQVVILPIPSVASTLVGVAIFGAFWATIYSLIGILLGSITAFFIGRKYGHKAVSWMVGEETLEKWQKKLKGKDNLFLTFAFVLPFFPDDILCFIAGLSTMSTRYFLVAVMLSRAVGIAATCYSIDFIPFDSWWGITLWCIFFLVISLGIIFIYKNMEKMASKNKRSGKTNRDKS